MCTLAFNEPLITRIWFYFINNCPKRLAHCKHLEKLQLKDYYEYLPCLLIFGLSYYNYLSIVDPEDFSTKNYFKINELKRMTIILKTILLDIF